MINKIHQKIAGVVMLGLFQLPLLSHHALPEGMSMNAWTGFLSGLLHPVIEIQHLLAILLIAMMAKSLLHNIFCIALVLLTSYVGWLLALPFQEYWLMLCLLCGSIYMLFQKTTWHPTVPLVLLSVALGLGFSEAVIGAQTGPVLTYILGLMLIQCVLGSGFFWAFKMLKQNFYDKTKVLTAGVSIGVSLSFFWSAALALF